jgi:hypothetical protein
MKPNSFEKLTDRQMKVLAHTLAFVNGTAEQVHYFNSEKSVYDLYPVDVAVIEPTKSFNNFIVTTVGLSAYKFEQFARAELVLFLPSEWKTDFSKWEYFWPVKFLQDVAFGVVNSEQGIFPGQLRVLNDTSNPYQTTDVVGGVVNYPEIMPVKFIEEKIDYDFTRFFQIVPITKSQLEKVQDVGVDKFTKFDLHDADGPLLNIDVPDVPKSEGKRIDEIIAHNERNLKGK